MAKNKFVVEALAPNASFGLPEPAATATPESDEIAQLRAQLAEANAKLAAIDEPKVEPLGDFDSQGFPKKYVKVRVFKGQGATDSPYVSPGINGFNIRIERGEDVIIPEVFAQVLEHAIESITIKSEGGLVTRDSHRFPFSVLGKATEAEYLAFKAKMKSTGGAAALQG